MITRALMVLMMALGISSLSAQMIDFSAQVSFTYDETPLQYVFEDLSARYGVKFSYSREILPMDLRISAVVQHAPFSEALEVLFDGTPIVYGFIADQLVLSVDSIRSGLDYGDADDGHDDSVAALDGIGISFAPRPTTTLAVLTPRTPAFDVPDRQEPIAALGPQYIIDERDRRFSTAEKEQSKFNVQATLMPPLRVSTTDDDAATMQLSMNMLWGVNHSVSGLEMGGLANILHEDMSGVQMSGIVNVVQNDVSGFQVAGVANVVKERSEGMQIAGVANLSGGGGDVVQVGGVTNVARDQVLAQIAGVANVAGKVNTQIGLVNVGRRVDGLQLGLINVCDTIKGVPIGLVSIVTHGYNSVEIAAEDAINANFNARLGARSFYNILHIGANEHADTWSLGYGIGTSIRTGRRSFLQLELMSRHVNEEERWTNDLNLLNQFNLIWDIGIGSRFRIALGPTFNVAVSQLYHPDTDAYGMMIPNYTFFNRTYYRGGRDPVNVKYWVGFHAGIRLNAKEPPGIPRRQRYELE